MSPYSNQNRADLTRRGAHRARQGAVASLLPLVAAALVMLAVVSLIYVVSKNFSSGKNTVEQAVVGDKAPASVGASASDRPNSTGPGATSVDPTGPSAGSKMLDFYNGTNPKVLGVTYRAQAKFDKATWKFGATEDWQGSPVTATTVFYGTADQRESAESVVATLGVGSVQQVDARIGKHIAVVLSNDFSG